MNLLINESFEHTKNNISNILLLPSMTGFKIGGQDFDTQKKF